MSPPPAFGTYRVLHQIGSGVLGPVFRAYDASHDRLVVIKSFSVDVLPQDVATLAERLRALAGTPPPHAAIARVVDAGVEDSRVFVVLDQLAGDTLDVAMRQLGAFSPARTCAVLRVMAEAIDAAWQVGLTHGALHPRDVFIAAAPGDIRITGFGIAPALRAFGIRCAVRRPYSAPEIATAAPKAPGELIAVSRGSDVYAVAAIAREMVGGNMPAAWDAVLARALSDQVDARPSSATALVAELETAVPELAARRAETIAEPPVPEPVAPVRPPVPASARAAAIEYDRPILYREARRQSRFPWAALGSVLAAGLVVGGAAGYLVGTRVTLPEAATVITIESPPGLAGRSASPPTPPAAAGDSGEVTATEEPVRPSDAARMAAPETPSPATGRQSEPARPPAVRARPAPVRLAASGGAIDIDSRPRGAKVFVDGRAFGTTPLRVPELTPGTHRVRIDLPGYRTVTSTVNIVGGELTRLGVTLEQLTSGRPATGRNR